jgi:phosphatidylserine decarboxylase
LTSKAPFRDRLLVRLLRWAPKRTFANAVGALARRRVPTALREPIYTAFAKRVGANLAEAGQPLQDYATFDDFFTRQLVPGARKIDERPDVVVSPCDGVVAEHGLATRGRMVQAKGHDYRLEHLLPDADAAARFEGGAYVTIYLAPKDYHRVHHPLDGRVNGFQHVPGAVFPVNSFAVKYVGGIFAMNERLITYVDTPMGEVAIVMVAATGVGHMSVTYDAVETRRVGRGRPGPRVRFAAPRRVRKGEELGAFHLGSTVILLFEPGKVKLGPISVGQVVRLGDAIAARPSAQRGDAAA